MSAPRVMPEAREVSDIVGTNVRLLRTAHGWSVKDFVELCNEAGWAVTSATMENIQGVRRTRKGEKEPAPRREISVDELVLLAKIFRVEPDRLLKPLVVRSALVIE